MKKIINGINLGFPLGRKQGQSIVEVVLAIGVVALILTGVISLVVSSLGSQNKGFDRKRATELAQVVIEELVNAKEYNSAGFWNSVGTSVNNQTKSQFPGYTYGIKYTQITAGNVSYPNCGQGGQVDCVEVLVTVSWLGSPAQSLSFTRFFAK